MRILVFSEVFYPEDFLINDLVREWVKMGHEVEVVTQYPSYPQSYVFEGYENKGYRSEDWEGVKIHRYLVVEGYKDSMMKKFEKMQYAENKRYIHTICCKALLLQSS